MRRVGVETGGSNVQFAVEPETGRQVVIEMNPRVSRSSALASKATGFPIAKIAAKLAVGYTLDEIPNDITRKTPASFEPIIDYVVTKVPRWAFEKLPGADTRLGTQMQSVGEAMAIGRTFPESLQKALRSLEHGRGGLNCDPGEAEFDAVATAELLARAAIATPERIFEVESLLRRGVGIEEVYEATRIDPWFLDQMLLIVEERGAPGVARQREPTRSRPWTHARWRRAKRLGFGDAQLGHLWGLSDEEVRAARLAAGVEVTYKTVDTCAPSSRPRRRTTTAPTRTTSEVAPSDREKVIILGSGPNRIGQGIEFDYCCVHACFALAEAGYETVMVNCNPETVSTDYDTSDRLYFEPLSTEGVLNVIEAERRSAEDGGGSLAGVIVSLGGQTPLKLADALPAELVLGTSPAASMRRRTATCGRRCAPASRSPSRRAAPRPRSSEALGIIDRIGYPALVRPVLRARWPGHGDRLRRRRPRPRLGGDHLHGSLGREGGPVGRASGAGRPLPRGRHRGRRRRDPRPHRRGDDRRDHGARRGGRGPLGRLGLCDPSGRARRRHRRRDRGLHAPHRRGTRGPWADQRAVRGEATGWRARRGQVFVIEANPRASRTVPFVAKATGVPLVKVAARVMCGATLAELRDEGLLVPRIDSGHVAVKEAVLPLTRFPEVDAVLGPEMRSTGEVMGIDASVGMAFAKSQLAAGDGMPTEGTVFFSLADRDKPIGTTAARASPSWVSGSSPPRAPPRTWVPRGSRSTTWWRSCPPHPASPTVRSAPTAWRLISDGRIQLVVNSPRGRGPRADGAHLRRAAAAHAFRC